MDFEDEEEGSFIRGRIETKTSSDDVEIRQSTSGAGTTKPPKKPKRSRSTADQAEEDARIKQITAKRELRNKKSKTSALFDPNRPGHVTGLFSMDEGSVKRRRLLSQTTSSLKKKKKKTKKSSHDDDDDDDDMEKQEAYSANQATKLTTVIPGTVLIGAVHKIIEPTTITSEDTDDSETEDHEQRRGGGLIISLPVSGLSGYVPYDHASAHSASLGYLDTDAFQPGQLVLASVLNNDALDKETFKRKKRYNKARNNTNHDITLTLRTSYIYRDTLPLKSLGKQKVHTIYGEIKSIEDHGATLVHPLTLPEHSARMSSSAKTAAAKGKKKKNFYKDMNLQCFLPNKFLPENNAVKLSIGTRLFVSIKSVNPENGVITVDARNQLIGSTAIDSADEKRTDSGGSNTKLVGKKLSKLPPSHIFPGLLLPVTVIKVLADGLDLKGEKQKKKKATTTANKSNKGGKKKNKGAAGETAFHTQLAELPITGVSVTFLNGLHGVIPLTHFPKSIINEMTTLTPANLIGQQWRASVLVSGHKAAHHTSSTASAVSGQSHLYFFLSCRSTVSQIVGVTRTQEDIKATKTIVEAYKVGTLLPLEKLIVHGIDWNSRAVILTEEKKEKKTNVPLFFLHASRLLVSSGSEKNTRFTGKDLRNALNDCPSINSRFTMEDTKITHVRVVGFNTFDQKIVIAPVTTKITTTTTTTTTSSTKADGSTTDSLADNNGLVGSSSKLLTAKDYRAGQIVTNCVVTSTRSFDPSTGFGVIVELPNQQGTALLPRSHLSDAISLTE
eukprot:g867.t1